MDRPPRPGLAWCARMHTIPPARRHARRVTRHTHARTRRRKVLVSVTVGGPPGPIRPDVGSIRTARWPRMRPTQRWHQTKLPKSWTNWTSHCRVFRATLAVHRDVHGRARLGKGRSPRSEPGPTRTATRAADRSSCRRRSQQCEWRASRCSAPQWPPQPAAATTRGSANHPRASTDPCLLDSSVRPFSPIARFEI
jgi:hypothetical protein